MVKVAVSSQMSDGADPERVIAGLNSILCREAQGQYATAVYVYLDDANQIGATLPPGIHPCCSGHRETRTLNRLNAGGLLLGVRREEAYSQSEFSFHPGDRLLIYTDGLVEAANVHGEQFGELRLSNFINAHENPFG
jgi:phosphoserine phosphatase RsbU/P